MTSPTTLLALTFKRGSRHERERGGSGGLKQYVTIDKDHQRLIHEQLITSN